MANWSITTIYLEGTEEDIKGLTQEIKSVIDDNYGLLVPTSTKLFELDEEGYSSMRNLDITFNEDSIEIDGLGQWSGPYNYIKELVEKFNLSGKYIDIEEGIGFSHYIGFYEGRIVSEENDDYFSSLSIEHKGIDYFISSYSWIPDYENWEEDNSYFIEIFEENGVSLE